MIDQKNINDLRSAEFLDKENLTLERLQQMVNKGERARIVWELLMDVVGCTYEDKTNVVITRLGEIQRDHMIAVGEMGKLIGMNHTVKKRAKKARVDGDVSTSN